MIPRTPSGKLDMQSLNNTSAWEDTVQACNQQLDQINLEVMSLLNKRAELVKKMRQLRGSDSRKRYFAEEIEVIIRRILGYNAGPMHDQALEEIFRKIMSNDIFLD
jgi:3-deoxy-7-phosphoheptulonate synthase/chorismate mutase